MVDVLLRDVEDYDYLRLCYDSVFVGSVLLAASYRIKFWRIASTFFVVAKL
jgi:hypothetical protein